MSQRLFPFIVFLFFLMSTAIGTLHSQIQTDIPTTSVTDTVTVTIPHVWALPGDTIRIPVTISPISTRDSIFSFEGTFSYEDSILSAITVSKERTLTEESEMSPTSNVIDNSLLFAFGGIYPLRGSGALVTLVFEVIDTVNIGQSSPIQVKRFMINEGNPYAVTQDAIFTVGVGSQLGMSHEVHHFANVEVGKSNLWQFSISNQGSADLYILDIYSDSTQFSFEPSHFPLTLQTGQDKTIFVTFKPSTEDTIKSRLKITTNDPQQPIAVITLSGIGTAPTSTIEDDLEINQRPDTYNLFQNYPNPFNPTTSIQYTVYSDRFVTQPVNLKIYNLLGQEVRTLVSTLQEGGMYSVTWDARDEGGKEVPSGIYLYRLGAGEWSKTKRMVYVR